MLRTESAQKIDAIFVARKHNNREKLRAESTPGERLLLLSSTQWPEKLARLPTDKTELINSRMRVEILTKVITAIEKQRPRDKRRP